LLVTTHGIAVAPATPGGGGKRSNKRVLTSTPHKFTLSASTPVYKRDDKGQMKKTPYSKLLEEMYGDDDDDDDFFVVNRQKSSEKADCGAASAAAAVKTCAIQPSTTTSGQSVWSDSDIELEV